MTNQLFILTKAPVVGRVKTRLGRDIGMARAARIARRLSARLARRLVRDPRWRTALVVAPDEFANRGRWWPMNIRRMGQGRGDLGARMGRVASRAARGPVVIVGTDVPGITRTLIHQAFRALQSHDVVVGPAEDGGYWLIGFARRRPVGPVFGSVRWSTPHALSDTLAGLLPGVSVAFLPVLRDVDTVDDLDGTDLCVSTL